MSELHHAASAPLPPQRERSRIEPGWVIVIILLVVIGGFVVIKVVDAQNRCDAASARGAELMGNSGLTSNSSADDYRASARELEDAADGIRASC
jgi:hypothetical protein